MKKAFNKKKYSQCLCSFLLIFAVTIVNYTGSLLLLGEPTPPKSLIR